MIIVHLKGIIVNYSSNVYQHY